MDNLRRRLENIKEWTNIDINSPNSKKKIESIIDNDLNNNNISDVNLYLNVKDKFSNLGKTSIELLEIYKFN
tara:strand:+ start:696 stop:911 length:216 start_codon:yes stop_codon:yes gene_type:complete